MPGSDADPPWSVPKGVPVGRFLLLSRFVTRRDRPDERDSLGDEYDVIADDLENAAASAGARHPPESELKGRELQTAMLMRVATEALGLIREHDPKLYSEIITGVVMYDKKAVFRTSSH